MTINHQINIVSLIAQVGSGQVLDMPIGVVGITNIASADVGKVIRIRTPADLLKLGGAVAENTILPYITTLQRYGFGNLFVVMSTYTTTPAIDTDLIAGLIKLKETFSLYQEFPRWIVVPGSTNSDLLVTAAIDTANATDSLIALDFPLGTTTAQATTIRQTSVGLGQKNARLHPCMPHVKVGALTEPLSIHLIRASASVAKFRGFGHTTSNIVLPDVTGNNGTFVWSYTNPTADNQLLERQGVTSLNMSAEGLVMWGNRNALYSPLNISWNTYTTLNRVKQELDFLFLQTSIKFLGMPSTAATGFLMETALNNILSTLLMEGNYDGSSRATFNQLGSNLAGRQIAFNVLIKCNLPLEVININSVYTANI